MYVLQHVVTGDTFRPFGHSVTLSRREAISILGIATVVHGVFSGLLLVCVALNDDNSL